MKLRMRPHPAFGMVFPKALGKGNAITVHHDINIEILLPQKQIPHKAAHHQHVDAHFVAHRADCLQKLHPVGGKLRPQLPRQLTAAFQVLRGFFSGGTLPKNQLPQQIGTGQSPHQLSVLHNREKALVAFQKHLLKHLDRRVRRHRGKFGVHVVGDQGFLKSVIEGLVHQMTGHDADHRPVAQHRHGVDVVTVEDLPRLADGQRRGNALDRRGHDVGGHATVPHMFFQHRRQPVQHLDQRQIPYRGRSRKGMSSAAEFAHDPIHGHFGNPGTPHQKDPARKTGGHDKRIQILHVPQLVGQLRQIAHIVARRSLRYGDFHLMYRDEAQRADHLMKQLYLLHRELRSEKITDGVQLGAAGEQKGRGTAVVCGCGTGKKAVGILVQPDHHQGRLFGRGTDPALLEQAGKDGDGGSHRRDMLLRTMQIIRTGSFMMIKNMDIHSGMLRHLGKRPDARLAADIHQNQAGDFIQLDIARIFETLCQIGIFPEKLLQAAFLPPGKDQSRFRIQLAGRQHGTESIKIGIQMGADNFHVQRLS